MVEILDVIAWPLVVLVCVVILRKPLAQLIGSTKRIKYEDNALEVEFFEELKAIEAEYQEVLPSNQDTQAQIDLAQLAEEAPNAAVLEAWKVVEGAAKELIESRGHTPDYDVATPLKLMEKMLAGTGLLDEKAVQVFSRLRQLRNKVVHAQGYTLSVEQAREYVDLALRLRKQILEQG